MVSILYFTVATFHTVNNKKFSNYKLHVKVKLKLLELKNSNLTLSLPVYSISSKSILEFCTSVKNYWTKGLSKFSVFNPLRTRSSLTSKSCQYLSGKYNSHGQATLKINRGYQSLQQFKVWKKSYFSSYFGNEFLIETRQMIDKYSKPFWWYFLYF